MRLESGVVHGALGVERRALGVERRAWSVERSATNESTRRGRSERAPTPLCKEKRGDADIAAPYHELLCPDRDVL